MIVTDNNTIWALLAVKEYILVGNKDKVTPNEALVKCHETLMEIKSAERAHFRVRSGSNFLSPDGLRHP